MPIKQGWDGTIKVGKPYQIAGVWYYPEDNPTYEEEGLASWYGDQFHLRPTANGETFDMNEISAAHRTLPMPSYVEVTNLDNGRQIVVRVNDRGPFRPNRIIDMSRRGAQLLGFKEQGTARVRVRRVFPENAPEVLLAARPDRALAEAPTSAMPPAVPVAALTATPLAPAIAPRPVTDVAAVTAIGTAFFIQLAAVGDRNRADVLAADMRGFGAVVVEPVTSAAGPLFRVRVGPYLTREAATAILTQVQALGYKDAQVLAPTQPIG